VPQNAPDASPCDLGVSPCDLGAQNSLCTKILIFGLYGGASFRPLAWMPLALQNHPFNTSHLGRGIAMNGYPPARQSKRQAPTM
jgi:hypothetical protein